MKKLRWKLLIVVVLLVALGSLFLLEDRFMGRVIWEPTTVVDNCSNSSIGALWNEAFDMSPSTGIVILKESSGTCKNFVAYKNISDSELLVILTENVVVGSGYKNDTSFLYYNFSSGVVSDFLTVSSVSEAWDFLESYADGNLSSWSMIDVSAATTKYGEIFDPVLGGSLSLQSGIYTYEEENITGSRTLKSLQGVDADAGFVALGFSDVLSAPVTLPAFTGVIPNYTFEMNSDWNDAFVLADYFGLEPGVNVGVYNYGYNNSLGAWINYSVSVGRAKFKPAAGFNGSRLFQMIAMSSSLGNNYSNDFWVNIVPDVDYPPVFQGKIDDFMINRTTNVTLLLDHFFEDPDGLDLTYTTSPVVDNVSIIFGWTKAYLWLKPSFTNYESFRIVASDGVHSTNSNLFTVYLNNNSGTGSGPAVDPGNDSLLVTSGNGSDSDSINGTVGSGGENSGDKSSIGFWIMVISGTILFFLIVGAAVYFGFYSKGPVPVPVPNNNMTNYLKKIKSGEAPPKNKVAAPANGTVAGVPVDRSAVDNYLKRINGPR